jgi:dihydrofolate synthase/folylpolyglutamate synthase
MKPGVPVVLAPQPPEAEAVILMRAESLGVPVRWAPAVRQTGADQRLPVPAGNLPRVRQNVTLDTGGAGLKVRLPLLGRHQQTNLAVAWAAVEALGECGFPVSAEQFIRGMEGLRWPGRFEIAEVRPWLVLDCAHNALSLQALAGALTDSLRYQRLVLVFGMSADKDIAEAAAQIAPLADQVVLTQAMMHRAEWASELTRATWPLWRNAPHVRWTVAESLELARELAGPQDCICVTGSIFVVAEALQALGRAVV